ncbi:unnamed protein product [Parajaminaea phylloscopi]
MHNVRSFLEYGTAVVHGSATVVARGGLYPARGVLPFLSAVLQSFVIVIALHTTLPCPPSAALHIARCASLLLVLYILYPVTFDRERYTLGSDFRDITIPSVVWLPLAEAVKVSLVAIWQTDSQRAPHWIVPHSQVHRWPGAERIPTHERGASEDRDDSEPPCDEPLPKDASYPLDVPAVWYRVPHPPLWSWRRLGWALDNLGLRRPGTSWQFPHEQRAMEWAHRPLVEAARIYSEANQLEHKQRDGAAARRRRREAPVWFGQLEGGFFSSALQAAALLVIFRYIRLLDLRAARGPYDFYNFPLLDQYAMTAALGCIVAFTFTPVEYLLYPFLLHVLKFPATAISPAFQQPLKSSGPADFWSRRWHQMLRRDFTTLALLMPGAASSKRLRALWTFSVSAMEHNFVFSRFLETPPSPAHALWVFLSPPFQAFFVSQGLLILVEQVTLGTARRNESFCIRLARRALLWVGLLTAGRWVTGRLVASGVFDPIEFFNWPRTITLRPAV